MKTPTQAIRDAQDLVKEVERVLFQGGRGPNLRARHDLGRKVTSIGTALTTARLGLNDEAARRLYALSRELYAGSVAKSVAAQECELVASYLTRGGSDAEG